MDGTPLLDYFLRERILSPDANHATLVSITTTEPIAGTRRSVSSIGFVPSGLTRTGTLYNEVADLNEVNAILLFSICVSKFPCTPLSGVHETPATTYKPDDTPNVPSFLVPHALAAPAATIFQCLLLLRLTSPALLPYILIQSQLLLRLLLFLPHLRFYRFLSPSLIRLTSWVRQPLWSFPVRLFGTFLLVSCVEKPNTLIFKNRFVSQDADVEQLTAEVQSLTDQAALLRS